MTKKTFEDCYDILVNLVEQKRSKWTLDADPSIGWEDVKMQILTHLNNKWHLYDQQQPLVNWASRVVSNKFKNILRDNYGVASPCHQCPQFLGGDSCKIFTTVSCECKIYKEWHDKKQNARNVKFPLTMENHLQEIHDKEDHTLMDLDRAKEKLGKVLKENLPPIEWKLYELMYIKHYEMEDVMKKMGYKYNANNKKRVKDMCVVIVSKTKKILKDYGVEEFDA